MTRTTDDLSMIYNPIHQKVKQEEEQEYDIKREISPPLNGTPPQKKKFRTDGISSLPTPPPSSGVSGVAAKMMVRNFEYSNLKKF